MTVVRVRLGERPRNLAYGAWRAIYDAARLAAVEEGSMLLHAAMVPNVPVGATGNLRNSIRFEVNPLAMTGFVGPTGGASLYAYWADQGRAPGRMPPYDAIAYWCLRVLGSTAPTWAIMRKIGREGTKGAHFVEKTAHGAGPVAAHVMARVFKEGMRRV